MAKILLAHSGIDYHQADKSGQTPLSLAEKRGDDENLLESKRNEWKLVAMEMKAL